MEQSVITRRVRVDDAVQRWRARRARNAGYTAEVTPYAGYGSTSWVRVLGRVLLAKGSQRDTETPTGARGWRNFIGVPIENAQVRVDLDGRSHEIQADRSGIIDVVVDVDLEPGWHRIGLSSENSQVATALVFIVDPQTRFGVVSDIDDTVMVTALPRPFLAAWHTFVVNEHARATTPGMPVLYERLSTRYAGAPFIYLSTGAWNVAPTLTRFLSRNLYPAGALLLTDWGPTADRWFRSGREHKRGNLERLTREFPQIKWLLVGDDGQHDESIYQRLRGAASRQCGGGVHPPAHAERGSARRQQLPRPRQVGWFDRAVALRALTVPASPTSWNASACSSRHRSNQRLKPKH